MAEQDQVANPTWIETFRTLRRKKKKWRELTGQERFRLVVIVSVMVLVPEFAIFALGLYNRDNGGGTVYQVAASSIMQNGYSSVRNGRVIYTWSRPNGFFYVVKYTAFDGGGAHNVFQCVFTTERNDGQTWVTPAGYPIEDLYRDSQRQAIEACRAWSQ